MNDKYTPADGEPVDMSEFTLGPRYGSEDMYRDMGIERPRLEVPWTDAVRTVTVTIGEGPTSDTLLADALLAAEEILEILHHRGTIGLHKESGAARVFDALNKVRAAKRELFSAERGSVDV